MQPNQQQQQQQAPQQQFIQQNGVMIRAPSVQQPAQVVIHHSGPPQQQQQHQQGQPIHHHSQLQTNPLQTIAPPNQLAPQHHHMQPGQQQQQSQQPALNQTPLPPHQQQQQSNVLQAQPQSQPSALPMAAYRQANKIAPVQKPSGLDPLDLLRERENCISQKIKYRIHELESLPGKLMGDELRLKVAIELKALRLLDFQKNLRHEIVSCMRADTTLETALNPKAYKRCKRQTLREARVTEKMERQQKQEAERKKRQKHMEYLNAVVEHSKNFKEVHRANVARVGKMAKAVISWHTNTERLQKKEQERLEKERIRLLMAEDEIGYRKLVNEKKDMRLAFLLSQTDEYIDSLTKLVKEHQDDLFRKKNNQKSTKKSSKKGGQEAGSGGNGGEVDEDSHVKVTNLGTGEVLEGEQAPRLSELDAWLDAHQGWEVVPRSAEEEDDEFDDDNSNSNNAAGNNAGKAEGGAQAVTIGADGEVILPQVEDDEYTSQTTSAFYGSAHRIKERVTGQASILVGGTLKQYQIHGLEWLISLYNNNLNGMCCFIVKFFHFSW